VTWKKTRDGKNMEKPWEKHGKTMGISMRISMT